MVLIDSKPRVVGANQVHPETKKSSWPSTVGPPIEVIQQPGETIFIPGGWHHTVLNLDDTVVGDAVTNVAAVYHVVSFGVVPAGLVAKLERFGVHLLPTSLGVSPS
jgi:hypothetical protein